MRDRRGPAVRAVPWSVGLAAAVALASPAARAQVPNGGIALDRYQPPPTAESFTAVPAPFAGGHLAPGGFVAFDYAGRPLVLESGSKDATVVGRQGFLLVGASLALWDRLLVSALLPVALIQGGDSPKVKGFSFPSPEKAQVGDLRLGLQVKLYGAGGDPFELAANLYVHTPTGPANTYAAESSIRLSPQVLVGGRVRWFRWGAQVGATFRGSDNPATLDYGAAVAAVLFGDRLHVGPEISATTPLQESFLAATSDAQRQIPWGTTTGAELLFAARVRLVGSLVLGAAGGPGLGKAIGTPAYRVVASLGWAPVPRPPKEAAAEATDDTDGDGIRDKDDACPYAFGAKNGKPGKNGCPAEDRDDDGVPDGEDACPEAPGKSSADAKQNGCPPDRDGDGVQDTLDACPDRKGSANKHGCP
jgi:OOP family OmpA-OmpF porin